MFTKNKSIIAVVVLLIAVIIGSQTFLPSGFFSDSNKVFATIYGNTTPKTVLVTSITLDKKSLSMRVNDKVKVNAVLKPDNSTRRTPSWFSSDRTVAVVSKDGTVKAVGLGTAIITAFTETQFSDCKVTVTAFAITPKPTVTAKPGKVTPKPSVKVTPKPKPVSVTGVTIDKAVTLKVKGTKQLVAIFKPTNATNKTLTWTSSNSSVVTVDAKGKITAKKAGKATITVKTKDGGKKSSCIVTVKK